MEQTLTVLETLNGCRVVTDGVKFGLEDTLAETPTHTKLNYRNHESALRTARLLSDENDQIDAYEKSHSK